MAWRRGIGQDPALNPKTSGFRVQRVRVSGLGHKSCTSRTLKILDRKSQETFEFDVVVLLFLAG